ncbi:MAG: FAD-dependent oxidoreductase [Gemmatimonadota bacterium]|nr:FAD-dependent oxidoreductase [Gemmatimonadota bacterium]
MWEHTQPQSHFPALHENLRADVCVVGAGLAGMTVAYLLAKAGKRVVVLEKDAVGAGETGQTTAHLSSALDDYFHELERMHGERGSRLAYESHQAAIERIGEISREEGIDCDYVRLDGYTFLAPGDTVDTLDREREAAHRAGFTDVERVERVPIDSFDSGPALRFPRQGRFHPLDYLTGLARAIHRLDGRIFTGTLVNEFHGGAEAHVRTESGFTVHADALVVATNSPANDRFAIHTKQAPYRTFAIGARVPTGSVPDLLLYDTAEPYRYVRLQRVRGEGGERELLIVGGEDHKTGQADDAEMRFSRLEAWARARFPVEEVEMRWSGQWMDPVDGLAFIGRNPADSDNVYIITGDSGHGMTHATLGAMLVSDLILGRPNEWETLYDPSRRTFSAPSLQEFAKENLNVAAQYADWLRSGEVESAEAIPPGHGAVLRRGARRIAAFRSEDGTVTERSATCTHLGCSVRWNSQERSWDCPCHGSRFAPTGEVLTGPAIAPLNPVEE